MRAITQDRYGSADVLRLEDVEPPVVGETEVMVPFRVFLQKDFLFFILIFSTTFNKII